MWLKSQDEVDAPATVASCDRALEAAAALRVIGASELLAALDDNAISVRHREFLGQEGSLAFAAGCDGGCR